MLKIYEAFMEYLPLIGSCGSILVVVGGIAVRMSQCHNFVCTWESVHPTAAESSQLALALAVLRAHFKHQDNAQAIQAVTPKPPAS